MVFGKYFTIFKIGWQNLLEYRFNFVLGRLRVILVLILFYYIWHSLSLFSSRFAGYSFLELVTYVLLGVNILRSAVFGAQSRKVASEINDGSFSNYLIKPINHFWFIFFKELGERSVYFITSVIEVIIFALLFNVDFFWQGNVVVLLFFAISCVLSIFLYFILSYIISLLAFWSREAMGPRFLYEWFLEFASGAYFPLDILAKPIFTALQFLPFMYLIYLPMSIYLGRVDFTQAGKGILIQFTWVIATSWFAYIIWNRGLRKYTSEGS